jgi:pimeloyl-ACP methyl ester carboxylesterase
MMDPQTLPWESEIVLPGRGRGRVLLIGGFGAGPEPLRALGERLQQQGAEVVVAALGHHVGDPEIFLRSRTWHYYLEAARRLRPWLRDGGPPVVVGGYSTGALVAALLASAAGSRVSGLVLISPMLRAAKPQTQWVGYGVGVLYYAGLPLAMLSATLAIVAKGRRLGFDRSRVALRVGATVAVVAAAALGMRRVTVPLRDGGPIDRDGHLVVPAHFSRASLVGGATLVPLQVAARRRLPTIATPACVLFGEEDDVVDVGFGVACARRMADADVHVIAGAPHRVVVHQRCHDIVAAFVEKRLAGH